MEISASPQLGVPCIEGGGSRLVTGLPQHSAVYEVGTGLAPVSAAQFYGPVNHAKLLPSHSGVSPLCNDRTIQGAS